MPIISIPIASGENDGYWGDAGGIYNRTGTSLLCGDDGSGELQNIYLRFVNVPMSSTDVITSGSITIVAGNGPVLQSYTMKGVAADNPGFPNTAAAGNTLSYVSTQVGFTGSPFSNGTTLTLPNISGILTQIFARPGWASGNALILVLDSTLTGASSSVNVRSYETVTSPNHRAILNIEYSGFTPPPPPTGTLVTNSFNMFIGQYCHDVLRPSGDLGVSPSGYAFNSIGTSGNMYSYINQDPDDTVTDSTYINVTGSGINNDMPYLVYCTYDPDLNQYQIKKYEVANSGISSLITWPATSGSIDEICVDYIDNSVYYLLNGDVDKYVRRYNMSSQNDSSIVQSTILESQFLNIDFYAKKLYFGDDHDLYKCELDGTNSQLVLSLPSNLIKSVREDLLTQNIYVLAQKNSNSNGKIRQYNRQGVLNSCIYSKTAIGQSYDSIDKLDSFFYIREGSNLNKYNINTGCSITSSGSVFGLTNLGDTFKIDRMRKEIYYIDNTFLTIVRVGASGTTATLITASGNQSMVSFDFPRDLFKTTQDFLLTDTKSTFGAVDYQLVTDARLNMRAKEDKVGSFVKPTVLRESDKALLWYGNNGHYSVWPIESGQFVQELGPGTITQLYNDRTNWDASLLRLETFNVIRSGDVFNFKIYSAEVNLSCSGAIDTEPTGVATNNSCNLFMCNTATLASGNMDLYLLSKASGNAHCDLFMKSLAMSSGYCNLYINGLGVTPTEPEPGTTTMNLFIKAVTPVPLSGHFPFFMWATASGVHGIFSTSPLFMQVDETTGLPNTNMNLNITGVGGIRTTSNMNLYLRSEPPSKNNWCSLFLGNNVSGVNEALTLFMQAPSGTLGAVPNSGMMNLFIARTSEALLNTTDMFLKTQDISSGNFGMFIEGRTAAYSSVPLHTFGKSTPHSNSTLYTHGF